MEFHVNKASILGKGELIRINTLEDLEGLYNDYGKHEIIIDFGTKSITIYNEYIE